MRNRTWPNVRVPALVGYGRRKFDGLATRRIALVAALVALSGCVQSQDAGDDYEARLATWQESEPPLYKWTVVWSEPVFGPFPMDILVRDGLPGRAYSFSEDRKLKIDGDQVAGRPGTVDALMDWLIQYAPEAKSVNVEWNAAGYPSRIALDHSDAIDDEIPPSRSRS